ncbi:unnamed protein product [Ilex paraguariensis]|uniref:CDT1 Geminin-binding domain-containing protein n=2 Tax=Ilex paraguariensis TaxID=185542 RepID=A0ABC8T3N7_9AQUA
MESSESSPFDPFKSKKILRSSFKPSVSPSDQTENKATNQSPWNSVTPEKPINPPRRLKNRRAAMSVKEVRQAAQRLQKPAPDPPTRSDPIVDAAKHQIATLPSETAAAKSKKADGSAKLPEKYEILDSFFNSLDSSIRLLQLKGSMSTFINISPKIECLTDRRFTYSHLAQLKFILPEAIEVKKVLTHDERTSCMRPDLHVTLNTNAIDNDEKMKLASGNARLRKVFHSRLLDFSKSHPEGDEIPEGTLPEPFNRSKQDLRTNIIKTSTSSLTCEISTDALVEQQPAASSLLSQSFRRRFSQPGSNQEVLNTHSSRKGIRAPAVPSPIKSSSKPSMDEECIALGASAASLPPSHPEPAATPVKKMDLTENEDCFSIGNASIQGTPANHVSTPAKLMSVTPALQPPKRHCMSPDDDTTRSPNKLVRRPPRSRSLKFDTPVKNAKLEDEGSESQRLLIDSDIFDILPENLLQSIREKERKALEEQDPAISQAKWRQQMIASLPKLFDRIHFLFQSIKRSIITKDELMHRIIASQLDIVDRREVEEQLRLLQELVPEWIYEKSASSGDLLLCINRITSPELIRTRLAEAN